MDGMFVLPQIHMLKLASNVMLIKGGGFWNCLGNEGKAFINGFSTLIKETLES